MTTFVPDVLVDGRDGDSGTGTLMIVCAPYQEVMDALEDHDLVLMSRWRN